MIVRLNESLEDGTKLVWAARVVEVDVSLALELYEDWAIMEGLDLLEEAEYDWSRVRCLEVQDILETSTEIGYDWGPRAEIYDTKVGDHLVVLDEERCMINDFTVDVVLEK